MVNTKHDTASYENCSYKREIFDANVLYEAYVKSKKGSDWKPQVQKYEMNFLVELAKTQKELETKSLDFLPPSKFILNERGRTRLITGEQIHDRVIKCALCEEELLPVIKKYLIYDNGASLKGKGIGFARKRLDVHLRRFYRENRGNNGYILLIDYSKYFDNIRHKEFVDLLKGHGISETALWLIKKIMMRSRVDVSYMDDCEFSMCMEAVFNSLEHQKIDRGLLVGEKFMHKHLNIGDPVSQIAGISYPAPLDNYVKIARGIKFYGRYMDDSYIIHADRGFLKSLLAEITEIAQGPGITINQKKTRICKLSDYWSFLQIKYSLTDTGRIVKKINPVRLTGMRRKLKKLAKVMHEKEFDDLYKSWFMSHYKIMSKAQRVNMDKLYCQLKEVYDV